MQIQILKSKIHRGRVNGADLNCIGSVIIDIVLVGAAKKFKPWIVFLDEPANSIELIP